MIKKNLANIITCTRILGTLVMLFLPVLSPAFFAVYVYCGLSDVLDGLVARSTHTASKLGSRLDSTSDLLFYVVMMVKMVPELRKVLTPAIWVSIAVILCLRLCMYAWVALRKGQMMSNHTVLNKLTGGLVFLVPFFVRSRFFRKYAVAVCAEALTAALYEGTLLGKEKADRQKNEKQEQ